MTGLRDRSKAARRARLLRAAARLFASRGYAATTISDIACAAGMATGTVFLYARDKQALLALVYADEVAAVQAKALAALADGDPFADRLMALFGAFYRYYGRNPELSRVFLKELAFPKFRYPRGS